MTTVTRAVKFRNERRLKRGRNPLLKLGVVFCLTVSLVLAGLSLLSFWYYANLTRQLPSVELLPSLLEPPNGTLLKPTRLYDRTGKHLILSLENPLASKKQSLRVAGDLDSGQGEFSKYLIYATVSEFEPDFWDSPGYSLSGIREGTHPTLAQQLVSDLVLYDEEPSLERNMRERMLAAQITAKYGREKVLEWYLNNKEYGELIFGADAAARVYFGKSAADVSLSEAAMLTAMAEKPGINPVTGAKMLEDQQNHILSRMLISGFIRSADAQKAVAQKLEFQAQANSNLLAPEFTALVLEQISAFVPLKQVLRGGFDIVTSLDYDLQSQTVCASEIQLDRLRGKAVSSANTGDTPCEAAKLLPTLPAMEDNLTEELNAEVVIIDPRTGQILAMAGDSSSGIEPEVPAEHPAGTVLSPLLYLTAFARGMSPATLLWDIPGNEASSRQNPEPASPLTSSEVIYHGPVRARIAFVNDYLSADQSAMQQVGDKNVWQTEERFGINVSQSQSENHGQTAFEDFLMQRLSVLECVQAYAVLADQGVLTGWDARMNDSNSAPGISSITVLKVTRADGKIWLEESPPMSVPITSQQLAYLITDVLSDETARMPSLGRPNTLEIGRPAGAKVSPAEDNTAAWAVGYIPQLTVGVWIGHLDNNGSSKASDIAAGLWHAIMQYASKKLPVENFPVSPGISKVQVCDPSGMLVSDQCPAVVKEVFLRGEEPTQVDNLYQKITINRETGRLATVFTPAALQEERVYLVVPPQAVEWAQQTGLSIPPDTYDSIYTPEKGSKDVQFTSPQMFDQVRGKVSFSGNASGEGFSYYHLQVGKGLNPQQWVQIGEDIDQPVKDGRLGAWDTTGLEGLYVVQLLVVRKDTRVEAANLQLTVDNSPPEVQIIEPSQGEQIAYKAGKQVLIRAAVSDNLVVDRLEFYMDGAQISTLSQPPYASVWTERIGKHQLLSKAYDLAGNMSSVSISFTVVP